MTYSRYSELPAYLNYTHTHTYLLYISCSKYTVHICHSRRIRHRDARCEVNRPFGRAIGIPRRHINPRVLRRSCWRFIYCPGCCLAEAWQWPGQNNNCYPSRPCIRVCSNETYLIIADLRNNLREESRESFQYVRGLLFLSTPY
jgi:hypothetical protein